MDLMNSGRTASIDPTNLAKALSLDIAVAARTSLPVLITAPPEFALPCWSWEPTMGGTTTTCLPNG